METEKTGVVYRIYHKESMKSYVGKSVHPQRRIREHLSGRTSSPAIRAAIKKYGADAFRVEVLESEVPESCLSKMEILHIRFFKSIAPDGYNLTDGGEGVSGLKRGDPWNKGKTSIYSDDTRRKMSEANKGKKLSPEARKKVSEAGKGRTPWNKGKKYTPEARQKMKGHPAHNKGKSPSPETRQKMSKAHKGRDPWNKGKTSIYSDGTRRKMSEARKGRSLSPETRQKISEAGKGRKHSPETRRKISESLKRRNRSS